MMMLQLILRVIKLKLAIKRSQAKMKKKYRNSLTEIVKLMLLIKYCYIDLGCVEDSIT
jgi:hypothetical protein